MIARNKQADLKILGERAGVRFSFASEERLEKYLNLKKGAVTPLGIFYDRNAAVEILVDRDLVGDPQLGERVIWQQSKFSWHFLGPVILKCFTG